MRSTLSGFRGSRASRAVAATTAALLVELLLTADGARLPAQQPQREAAFGELRDRDGKPFGGATVHLLWRAHPAIVDPAYEEHLTVTTDERGRFRASVLRGLPYTVWATAPLDARTFRCSNVVSHVVAGSVVVLAEDMLHRRQQVHIPVDASWHQRLRFVVRAALDDVVLQQELADEDRTVTLPEWPVSSLSLEVWAGEQRVHALPFGMLRAEGAETGEGGGAGGESGVLASALEGPGTCPLPPRQQLDVRLRDADGKPLAGAVLFEDRGPFAEPVGVTDADGVLPLSGVAPHGPRGPWCALLADKAEFAVRPDHLAADEEGKSKRPLDLAPGITVQGRLLLGDGIPLANAPVVLDASIRNGDNGWWWGVHPRLLRTDADGGIVLHGRHEQMPFRLSVLLTSAQLATLAGEHKAPVWPVVMVAPERIGEPKDLGPLRLDELAAVEVSLQPPPGTPPGPIAFALFPLLEAKANTVRIPVRALLARTDRHGRMRVLLPKGTEVAVFAATRQGGAYGAATAGGAVFDRQLDPSHVQRLLVREPDGALLVGATANFSHFDVRRLPEPARRFGYLLREPMVHSWFPLASGQADADGRVDLVAPLPGLGLGGYVRRKDGASMSFKIEAGEPADEPIRIEFVPTGR